MWRRAGREVCAGGRGGAVFGAKPCEFSLDNIKPERARTDVKFYEVALLEFVASDWVSGIFCDIFFNEPAFVNMA